MNNLLNTINYTAPGYHTSSAGSDRSDIFSPGVIAYELLTEKRLYGRNLSARNINRLNYRSTKNSDSGIPSRVDKAIEKAVHINPEQHFAHLSEFIYALSNPDSRLVNRNFIPLPKHNPLRIWYCLSRIYY